MKNAMQSPGDAFYSVSELSDLFDVTSAWVFRTCEDHNIPLYCSESDIAVSAEGASELHHWYCYYLAKSPLSFSELY